MENATPDVLEFAQLFPKVVEDHLLRITTLPFIHYTQPKSYYEKLEKGYLSCDSIPKIDKRLSRLVTPHESQLNEDYRSAYLQGVRS